MAEFYQQGDIIVAPISKISKKDLVAMKPGMYGFVIADGEATGHRHCVDVQEGVEVMEVKEGNRLEDGTYLYIFATKPFTLNHIKADHSPTKEHEPIKFEPGNYKVRKVVEYDHFEQAAREVRD